MDVRKVRMSVDERVVLMNMSVRLDPVPRKVMAMPVMFVVPMRVLVRHCLVRVHVLVPLGEMKVDTQRHQRPRHGKLLCDRFVHNDDRKHGAEKWRHGEIRACARGAKVP